MPPPNPSPGLLLPVALSALLGGCLAPVEKPAAPVLHTPDGFSTSVATRQSANPWWQDALQPAVAGPIDTLLRDNPAIRIAAQDVAAQQARLDEAEAQRWLDVEASASSRGQRTDDVGSDTLRLGLDARLPLDLSGRLAQTRDAAAFELAQRLAELEQVRLQQVQDYLLSHIDAAEASQRLALLAQQLESAGTLLRLTELRFAQGLASSVDVLQQREQLAALRLEPNKTELRRRIASNRLAALLAQTPDLGTDAPTALPRIAAVFPVRRPAELLQRRPDLLARQAALAASDRRYEAALREKLPALDLDSGALLQLASGDASRLLYIALEASASLFDSGRLDARAAARRAELERSGIEYLQAWLQAVRETEDLLHTLQAVRTQVALSEQRNRVATELFEASRRRYERGVSDYLPVLAALRTLQQQQRDHLALQAEQLRVIVRLHSAMGLPGPTAEG
ncbi:MAG: TolC family protein, partial [Halieaceae bacterium]|nr:TolC family protein [Halieaceae bacterium]